MEKYYKLKDLKIENLLESYSDCEVYVTATGISICKDGNIEYSISLKDLKNIMKLITLQNKKKSMTIRVDGN